MKYIVFLGDGMADYPMEKLGGRTPLEAAVKPNMDILAQKGMLGMVRTVPEGMKPGSDVANLAAMGYDPRESYSGRSPLEAVSMGIKLSDTDIAVRCNLVTLSQEEKYEGKKMVDYSAGEITSQEAEELMLAVNEMFKTAEIEFHHGISYRHCMIWHGGHTDLELTPPHDISGKTVRDYLPASSLFRGMMEKSYELLKNHPVNIERIKRGKNPANSIWLWGEGTRPAISEFYGRFGVKGSVISAVDLIKGIGICAGLDSVDVPGATGNIHTNFKGKGEAALKELLRGKDFVYIHVEAPDECGHQGDLTGKILSIELIDRDIIGPVLAGLDAAGEEYSALVLPDHPTPISLMTHVSDPVPFILYRSGEKTGPGGKSYTERAAAETGVYIENGYELMNLMIKK